MPIRPAGVPKPVAAAPAVVDTYYALQVTTDAQGRATVTFSANVVAASVQASPVDAAGSAVAVSVESIAGAVVKIRTYRAGTLFAAGSSVVNVTARKVNP